MRILQIFNRYAFIGGEEIAVDRISEDLAKHHEFRAITFDSQKWATETGFLSRLRQFFAMAWNPKSLGIVRKEIREFQPDVILLHNIMPVGSAALFLYLTRCGVPVIQYVHNFRPFSINGYCWGHGRLLPQGLRKNFIPEIIAGAWQNSILKTAWYALLIRLLHALGTYRRIDGWIAISRFMRDTFVEGGIDPAKIRVLAHSWQPRQEPESRNDDAHEEPVFLFLGRLTEEKGPLVLLDAWQRIEDAGIKARLVLAGDGPLAEEVSRRCSTLRHANFVGFQSGDSKDQLLRDCTAMVVPSIWWEPLGLVLYEAYDHSKPVLAARSGGIVDHVEDGLTGWLHHPGNVEQLASQIREAALSAEECKVRGARGRKLLLDRSTGVWIHDFDAFVGEIVAHSPHRRPIQPTTSLAEASPLRANVYLADQNPGHDRSFGISRMSQVVLEALHATGSVRIHSIASKTSQHAPPGVGTTRILPWGTRRKSVRLLTDHFYPLLARRDDAADLHYFPKGYLPWFSRLCRPTVVTIHDTIIQYDEDRYPEWRSAGEYAYWAWMLKHTLRKADLILTVSEASKGQILAFMDRHRIPRKEIIVTFEPCIYESLPQPVDPPKENYVIHLTSAEPHKRSAHLIRWWHEAESAGRELPMLHLIGSVPREVEGLLASSRSIVKRPFLEDQALQAAYREAKALILPSEIEGFGLPALEAYYLGTPVCFVRGTSVEEVLGVATAKGGFTLEDPDTLVAALEEVVAMSPDEIRDCGLKLRETYAAEKVAVRMLEAFRGVAKRSRAADSNLRAAP